MKKFKIFTSIILIMLVIIGVYQLAFANTVNGINKTYNFYISTEGISNDEDTTIFIANSVDKSTLVDNKIAPGVSGSFEIKLNIADDVETEYTMSFDNFSSNLPQNLKVFYEGKLIDLTQFEVNGIQKSDNVSYIFTWEWSYDENSKEKDKLDTADSLLGDISFNVILKASYQSIYCNVYFVDGNTIHTEKIERNTAVNKPNSPVKDRFSFLNWVDKEGKIFDFDTKINEDTYLYATYVEIHSVYFVNDNETSCVFVENGNKVDKPENLQKEGYIFEGWFDENGNIYDFNSVVTEDIILHVKWKKVYKVYFIDEMTKSIVEVIEGEQVSPIKANKKSGFSFVGWVDEYGNLYNFETPVINDLILFAKFEKTLPRTGDII